MTQHIKNTLQYKHKVTAQKGVHFLQVDLSVFLHPGLTCETCLAVSDRALPTPQATLALRTTNNRQQRHMSRVGIKYTLVDQTQI